MSWIKLGAKKQASDSCRQLNDVPDLLSLFDINNTQGRIMGLNDLLNIEVYNDSLKMFSQAWEEIAIVPGQRDW